MISIYNPDYPGPVYCQPCFWSDKWDPLQYGKEYEPNRLFFDQFKEVRFRTPKIALAGFRRVNSEYTNQAQDLKNCYMIVASDQSEDYLYGNWNAKSKFCCDCYAVEECELLYESLNCKSCYKGSYLEHCESCSDSYFLYDCQGCNNCFGCVGLRNKSYYWFNQPISKEEYKKRFNEILWTKDNINKFRAELRNLEQVHPHKYYQGRQIVSSSGDYMENVKNSRQVFNARHTEDISYSQDAWRVKNGLDLTEVAFNEMDYELEGVGYSSHNIGCSKTWNTSQSYYTDNCFSCDYIFGGVSLHKKKYCILNRQYSNEEYDSLKTQIIEQMHSSKEWGEFLPASISSFAYNESLAQDYFPLTKENALKHGFRWYDRPTRDYKATKQHNEITGTIDEVADDISKQIVSCKTQDDTNLKKDYLSCATAFRITPAEFQFYKKMKLPIPDKCFPCRLQDRLGLRNPRKLWPRKCMCDYKIYPNTAKHAHHPEGACLNEFETSYSLDRPEIIYCESCYNSEVV